MKLPRRNFLHLAACAAALPAASRIARAQAYPTRPVRIIVGFTAGGAGDITARLIGQWLTERLGQQFVIDNRPGAGSNIATGRRCRTSRPWVSSCRATRGVIGTASTYRRPRRPRSSTNSTRRSMRLSTTQDEGPSR